MRQLQPQTLININFLQERNWIGTQDVTKVYVPDFKYMDNFCLHNILLEVLTSLICQYVSAHVHSRFQNLGHMSELAFFKSQIYQLSSYKPVSLQVFFGPFLYIVKSKSPHSNHFLTQLSLFYSKFCTKRHPRKTRQSFSSAVAKISSCRVYCMQLVEGELHSQEVLGSIQVSEKLRTYPSPKSTLTFLVQGKMLAQGRGRRAVSQKP